jgi:hypothetical protein
MCVLPILNFTRIDIRGHGADPSVSAAVVVILFPFLCEDKVFELCDHFVSGVAC